MLHMEVASSTDSGKGDFQIIIDDLAKAINYTYVFARFKAVLD